jgi:hypothetical protein
VYLRYFWQIDAVSTAAIWQVSALHELGSLTSSLQFGEGYAICWCKRIMEVLWVRCAKVRFGSMSTRETSLEIFESFHF